MSEATRAAALQHAAMVHKGSGDAAATLETAEAFHAFVAGDGQESAPPANSRKPATKPAATKPATKPAVKKVVPPVDDDAGEEEAAEEGEVSKEEVGAAIEEMLNANLRPQAIALFKKYGAKSLSGVKAEDYPAILQDAQDAVMAS